MHKYKNYRFLNIFSSIIKKLNNLSCNTSIKTTRNLVYKYSKSVIISQNFLNMVISQLYEALPTITMDAITSVRVIFKRPKCI